ncbi:MAG TPA: class I SAM-dependent rRNA methyltransferase [Bacillota bacterium]|nr:class I SAM-dependent rRNA methyltransferase [Bacillota bacterium]
MRAVGKNNEWMVKPKYVRRYKDGYPLITKDVLVSGGKTAREGDIIHLVDTGHRFIAKGYCGKQNKGIGWVLTTDKNIKLNASFFKKAIEQAITHRKPLYKDAQTNAFRVFNGEGDGIGGLTIDYYDGYYVINWYSEGIYAYKSWVVQTIEQLSDCQAIYEKKRFKKKGSYIDDDDFVSGKWADFPLIVKENNMHYAVDLNDGAMTGIFLDQRDVRKVIRDRYASGKRVLNTFSYTGAFSVAASLGGALQTTNVDLAKRSLPKTIEQFSVNGIDFEAENIHVMDIFEYFKYARRKKLTFDMVILDPPSFARTKKYAFSVMKDYTKLLTEALSITEKGGIIVASTNNAALSRKKFKNMLVEGFEKEKKSYRILEEYSLPEDFRVHKQFPSGDYLKVVIMQVVGTQ